MSHLRRYGVHIHIIILLRHKNKILQFAAKWMDLENMLSERCLGRGIMQIEENKYRITQSYMKTLKL